MTTTMTTIGEGRAIVCCEYTVSYDGDVEDLEVFFGGKDITPCLTLEQIEDLEIECYQDYCKQAQEHNDDMRIERYLSDRESV